MVKGTQDIFIGHVTTVVSKLPSLINWHPVVCALFSDKRSIAFFLPFFLLVHAPYLL